MDLLLNLLNFTRKTSWHLEIFVCERSTILFSILHYFPCCKENWVKYDNTSREIIRYHILSFTYKFCPRILRKTFSGTSWIPILHFTFYRKQEKSRTILEHKDRNNFFEQMYFQIRLLEILSNETIKIDWNAIKRDFDPFIHIDTKIWETPYEF